MHQVRKFLSRVLDIRDGELLRAFLMFSYLFLIIASYITTTSVRDSLFLRKLGSAQLPYVYLLIAMVVGLISPFYSRAASRTTLNQVIRYTSLASILSLLIFWWVLKLKYNRPWMYYGLYVWVSIFGAITTSQFWLLANHVFNPREAKRLFPLIGAGGVLGSTFGGFFTGYLAIRFGSESLLLCCVGFIAIAALLAARAWTSAPDSDTSRQSFIASGETARSVKLILDSRHLTLLTAILTLTVVISSLTDYELKFISEHSFRSKDQLTSFFGGLYTGLGVFSLFFQVFITS